MTNAEALSIGLSAATLLVITAAAVAAIVQLRHLRASNQLAALLEILNQWNQPTLREAFARFSETMATKLQDPSYIALLKTPGTSDRAAHPEFLVLDFWEQVGTYCKHGLVDEAILLDIVSAQVAIAWNKAEPAIRIIRERAGLSALENFEYLAMRADQWTSKYPDGTYPAGLARMPELPHPPPVPASNDESPS